MAPVLHPTSNTPASNLQSGARLALVGMIANVLLAAAKIVTGFLGNSYVLIAEPFTLIVLVAAVITKELLYRTVVRLGKNVESTAVQTDAWHHRADALTSIAAFVGISIALIGGENWRSADDWAALFACVLIAANGLRLLAPALREIMDTAPRGEIINGVRSAAASVPGVVEIDKCLVRKMGLAFYVDLHIGVKETISVREGHHIAHRVKDAIRATNSNIADVLVHIEPAKLTR